MFSKVDLVFPMPENRGEEYLAEVLQHRSDHLKAIAGAADPVSDTYDKYLSLIKEGAPIAEIEGIAQLIRYMEWTPIEDQICYIKNSPIYQTGQLVRLGTLVFSGSYSDENECYEYNNGEISIENTVRGKELQFIFIAIDGKQLLVSNRNLIYNISWMDLNNQGLINGRQVIIDGHKYLLRVLTGGKTKRDSSEWDAMLHLAGSSENIWHWRSHFSWCKEEEPEAEGCYILRGGTDSWNYGYVGGSAHNETFAWRPVLELL